MSNRNAFFDDVQELRNESLGVLGGEGAAYLEKVKTEVTPAGIVSQCPCGQCGKPNIITVEWPEAIVGSQKLKPRDWELDTDKSSGKVSIFPNVPCATCHYQLKLLFTPQELSRLIDTGIRQGDINGAWAQSYAAQVVQQAGGRR